MWRCSATEHGERIAVYPSGDSYALSSALQMLNIYFFFRKYSGL
jgi:hypothetical protein